jgi:hypothetical protein
VTYSRSRALSEANEAPRDRLLAVVITLAFHVFLLCLAIGRSGLHGSAGRLNSGDGSGDFEVQFVALPSAKTVPVATKKPDHSQLSERSQTGTHAVLGETQNLPLSKTGISAGSTAASQSAATSASASGAAAGDDLDAKYRAAIRQAVMSQWSKVKGAKPGETCVLTIQQEPGGKVLSAITQDPCALDEASRRTLEAAALIVQPLPYAGFESVFQAQIDVAFESN